ncbi:MAG: hypothetical protein IIC50_04745 [Planctomycetes bacterium]|nr:hypothetical protein [Planctomycetota bacterium]
MTICLAGVSSCGESARRSLLTFFFEGVPARPEETAESPARPDSRDDDLFALKASAELTWYVHEPVRQCERCHGDQIERQFSREVGLVADVPQLCYECHQEIAVHRHWVHEPVAEGDCLWCHEPHRSLHEHLLLEPAPGLCYQCHDSRAIEEIDYHDLPGYRRCTDCHTGHSSDIKFLLIAASAGGKTSFDHEDYKAVLSLAHEDAERGTDFRIMVATVLRHIEQRDLGSARAYLMGIRGSGKVSASETQQWQDVFRHLEAQERIAAEQQALSGRDHTRRVAQRYYESMEQYHRGHLEDARRGFTEVLESGLVPAAMRKTIEQYRRRIDEALTTPDNREGDGGR